MRTIAVVNQKGGSAKTTTALCLAVGMARRGLRTVLIDADSQSNASMTMLDGAAIDPPTLGNVLLDQVDAAEAIRPTRVGGLDVLPADTQLADVALLLADGLGREHRLRNALDSLAGRYDAAIVDCPPQTSLVVVNVLAAVAELVVPIDAGVYSVSGLASLQTRLSVMANPRGMTLPSALIRPPASPESAEVLDGVEGESIETTEGQGRGAQESRPAAKARRRRPVASAEKTSKRGLYLTDAVWERLQLEAIRKRVSVSAVAGDVLERNLARLRIEREA